MATPFVGALLLGLVVGGVAALEYGAAAGFLAGIGGAIAIDAGLLAFERGPKSAPR